MLLKSYQKRIFRPECNPSFESLHCIAHLDQDISPVLPYLNAVLGGYIYIKDPPSLTLRVHGKLIALYSDRIAINALINAEEADKILSWLQKEINETWEKRDQIQPSYESAPQPQIMEILKHFKNLPRLKNCQRACGQSSCSILAELILEGVKGPEDCPVMPEESRKEICEYLSAFTLPAQAI